MTTSAREEWTVIARKQGEKEGVRLFISENARYEAELWLAGHPQPADIETAIVDDPLDAPFPTSPGADTEFSPYRPPEWRIITREPGQQHGRTLAVTQISREHAERFLARNPQPAGSETCIVDDGEEPPFPAPSDAETVRFVPPSRELTHLLQLAKQGERAKMPAVERQARKLVLAIVKNARTLDDDSIDTVIPELIRWAQEGPDARDEILEAMEAGE